MDPLLSCPTCQPHPAMDALEAAGLYVSCGQIDGDREACLVKMCGALGLLLWKGPVPAAPVLAERIEWGTPAHLLALYLRDGWKVDDMLANALLNAEAGV